MVEAREPVSKPKPEGAESLPVGSPERSGAWMLEQRTHEGTGIQP